MTILLLVVAFITAAASVGYLLYTFFLNCRIRRQGAELWRENVLRELRRIGETGNTLKVPTQFELSRDDYDDMGADENDRYPVVYRDRPAGPPWWSVSRNQ